MRYTLGEDVKLCNFLVQIFSVPKYSKYLFMRTFYKDISIYKDILIIVKKALLESFPPTLAGRNFEGLLLNYWRLYC